MTWLRRTVVKEKKIRLAGDEGSPDHLENTGGRDRAEANRPPIFLSGEYLKPSSSLPNHSSPTPTPKKNMVVFIL